jgi:hypothetical protein
LLARGNYSEANWQGPTWQLRYDRMFDRVMDNRKILDATGMKQFELMPLYDGLKLERQTILE